MRGLNFKTAEPRPGTESRKPGCRPSTGFKLPPELAMRSTGGIEKVKQLKNLVWDSVRFGKRKRMYYYCKTFKKCTGAYRAVVGTLGYHAKFGLHIANADPRKWQVELKSHNGMLGGSKAVAAPGHKFSFKGRAFFATVQVPEKSWNGLTTITESVGHAHHPHQGQAVQVTRQEARDSFQESAYDSVNVPAQAMVPSNIITISAGNIRIAAPSSAPIAAIVDEIRVAFLQPAQSFSPTESRTVPAPGLNHEAPAAVNTPVQAVQSAGMVSVEGALAPQHHDKVKLGRVILSTAEPITLFNPGPQPITSPVSWHAVSKPNPIANPEVRTARVSITRTEPGKAQHARVETHANCWSAIAKNPEPATHQAKQGTGRPRLAGYYPARVLRRVKQKKVVGAEALPE